MQEYRCEGWEECEVTLCPHFEKHKQVASCTVTSGYCASLHRDCCCYEVEDKDEDRRDRKD